MSAFSVTASSEMSKQITNLRTKNQSLKQQISKMKESKEELNSTWEGTAKKNFSSAVESDATQMTNFHSLIEQYCSALESIINKYETTEANNANTVAKRNY